MKQEENLEYWKQNAEDDYITTPISVLKYITKLETELESTKPVNVDLGGVSWVKSWLYPFLWALFISVILMPFTKVDSAIFNEYMNGWISASAFWIVKNAYNS